MSFEFTFFLFQKSNIASKLIDDCQKRLGWKTKELIQVCPTRWNSEFEMIERCVELRQALVLFCNEAEGLETAPTPTDWLIAEELVPALKPLYTATIDLSFETKSTISRVIPMTNQLLSLYEVDEDDYSTIGQLKKVIFNSIKTRLGKAEETPVTAIATLIDPRYKDWAFCCGEEKIDAAKEMLRKETAEINQENLDEPIEPESEHEDDDAEERPPPAKKSMVFGFLEEKKKALLSKKRKESKKKNVVKSKIDIEIKEYFDLEPIDQDKDPFDWWIDEGQQKFPNLFETAMKFLIITATSVPSERIFSTAGLVYVAKRSKLDPKTADMCITLHKNLEESDLV